MVCVSIPLQIAKLKWTFIGLRNYKIAEIGNNCWEMESKYEIWNDTKIRLLIHQGKLEILDISVEYITLLTLIYINIVFIYINSWQKNYSFFNSHTSFIVTVCLQKSYKRLKVFLLKEFSNILKLLDLILKSINLKYQSFRILFLSNDDKIRNPNINFFK